MKVEFCTTQLLEWTRGTRVQGGDAAFHGASIDTRTVSQRELFVAIAGPNYDAHQFVGDAIAKGAAGLLVEAGRTLGGDIPADFPIVSVPDTTQGLGNLAAGHRATFTGPVVAITGSNGKTTTKEMCAAILSVDAPCLKTEGNLNNNYGLPLTLLRRHEDDQNAVVEMGMNHRGEIAVLMAIGKPSVGLITNVGTAHIEHLGSIEEIAAEKGDLFAKLPAEGVAAVNLDDARVAAQAERFGGRKLTYGLSESADVRGERVEFLRGRGYEFHLRTPSGEAAIYVRGLGETTVINALAASAAAIGAGAPVENVRAGLASYRPISGRMSQITLDRDVTLIDDTYNANPQSMRASLEALARLKCDGRGIAVLGDMGELGDTGERAHREMGRLVSDLHIDALCTFGKQAEQIAEAAIEAGMSADRVSSSEDCDQTAQQLLTWLQPSDWVLVKGSRAMKMERIVEAVADQERN